LEVGQAEMARFLQITPQRMNNYEVGLRPFDVELATRMADRWRLTLDWFYRGDDTGLPRNIAERIAERREAAEHAERIAERHEAIERIVERRKAEERIAKQAERRQAMERIVARHTAEDRIAKQAERRKTADRRSERNRSKVK
jgi:transcriptional regulator with XRE-family HTH domain